MADRVSTIVVRALHAAPDAGTSGTSTPIARLALVETLTHEAWTLTGRALPSYARSDTPVRVRPLHGGSEPTNG